MTQYDHIYRWLLLNRTLVRLMTPAHAFAMRPRCTKLASRIGEMIRDGYDIRKQWVDSRTRKHSCMGYYLGMIKK